MASTPTTGLGLLPFADASMMLIQQRRSLNATPEKSRDEPREVPKVRNLNNHIAKEARDIYLEFANDIMALEHNLDAFMRAVRPIGSSSGLIYAAMELKRQDMSILRICGSIAGAIWRRGPSNSDQADLPERMRSELIYPVCLEDGLGKLSSALRGFLNSLQDIPEFSDTPLTDFLHRSIEWLDYRADALTQEQELDPERQISTARLRYLCQLLKELSFYIRQVTAGLTSFLQDGVVVLRDAQDRAQNRLQNMSTVATFFSAVTATTLQYSIDPEKFLGTLVGSLWVSSLILSVASAINLQLAMHWRAAMYRSPRRALPAWASFCLDHTPIVFLVAAVLTFSAGLVAWTFSSGFGILVSTSAAALTGLTTVIISTIFAWEAREIVLDYTRTHPSLYQSLESSQLPQTWSQVKTLCLKAATTSLDAVRWTAALMQSKWQETTANIHGHELPTIRGSLNGSGTHEGRQDSRKSTLPRLNSFGSWLSGASRKTATPARTSPPPATLTPSGRSESSTVQNVLPEIPPEECIEIPASLNRLSSKAKFLKLDPGLRATIRDAPATQNESRREELKALRPTRTLPVNHNVKDDISFSPDGNRLAISTIERQVLIWDVMELSEEPVRLPAPTGRFAWSLDGSLLLSVLQEGFRVWDIKDLKDVTPFPTRQLPHTMGPFTWLHQQNAFVTVINRSLCVYNAAGTLQAEFKNFSRCTLDVTEIALMPEVEGVLGTLLLIGKAVISHDNASSLLHRKPPIGATPEHRLVVYNLDHNSGDLVEDPQEASFIGNVRHVSANRHGTQALLSFSKNAFPELWQLRDSQDQVSLELRQIFNRPIKGKAFFGDEWVIACGINSEIYVWDHARDYLLEVLSPDPLSYRVSWNAQTHVDLVAITSPVLSTGTKMLLASVSKRGQVVIWECVQENTTLGSALGQYMMLSPPLSIRTSGETANECSS